MSESFLETPTPSRQWSESVVNQTFRAIVNGDGLATRHGVKLEYLWSPFDDGYAVGGVRVWLAFGTPEAVMLHAIERNPDSNLKADLIDGFKTVRKLLMLL
jgi:hypothetical protein